MNKEFLFKISENDLVNKFCNENKFIPYDENITKSLELFAQCFDQEKKKEAIAFNLFTAMNDWHYEKTIERGEVYYNYDSEEYLTPEQLYSLYLCSQNKSELSTK